MKDYVCRVRCSKDSGLGYYIKFLRFLLGIGSLLNVEFGKFRVWFGRRLLIATSNQLVVSVVYLVLNAEGTTSIECRV